MLIDLWATARSNRPDRGRRTIRNLPSQVGRLIEAAADRAGNARQICDGLAGLPRRHSARLLPLHKINALCSAVMLAMGFLLGAAEVRAQEKAQAPDQRESVVDPKTFLHLKLPKEQAMAFYQAWTRAHADLDHGRAPEARRGFATVISMLEGMEANPAQRERALLTKVQLYGRVLGDRVAARRELGRALTLNPKSAEALSFEKQLGFEEGKSQVSPEAAPPPVTLLPRAAQKKEGTP